MENENVVKTGSGRGGSRPGAGRKKKSVSRITVNIQKDVARILEVYAHEHELAQSECVNRILRDWYYSKYGIRP